MIKYTESFESMLKAYMLSRLTNDIIADSNSFCNTLLEFGCKEVNSNDFELDDLLYRYEKNFNSKTDWIFTSSCSSLRKLIYYTNRNSASDRHQVIFKAFGDCFSRGIEYCLQGVSPDSKRLIKLYRAVSHEIAYMLGFIRFKKITDNCLAATVKISHNTLDIILKKLQNRYPNHKIVLISDTSALSIQNSELSPVDRDEYLELMKKDNYDDIWKDYYKSQYIKGRKNIKLAASKIPKKYWDWLPEGELLKQESE